MTTESLLTPLHRLVGRWTTEASHPALPGIVVQGIGIIEWLEGERFLIHRARTDHPYFPDSISIIGCTQQDRVDGAVDKETLAEPQLSMHYFDSRGVFRVYDVSVDDASWRIWRDAPGFSQRFLGTLGEGGNSIEGRWQLRQDDVHWNDDLRITYRRSP